MGGLEMLGTAAVGEDELAEMLAAHHDWSGPVTVEQVEVAEVPYGLDALTTAQRHVVRGRARTPDGPRPFRLFVKVVQAFTRSPLYRTVPVDLREMAADSVPWRSEPLAYASDLADRLPPGLTMPRAVAVRELDEESSAIWLEELEIREVRWDRACDEAAALALGRLAGSPRVAERSRFDGEGWSLRTYLEGRMTHQILPILRDEALWSHPLVAGSFDDPLRTRLLAVADRVAALTEEALALPHTPAHGDACPNNLLTVDGVDGFVLIDYGFWMPMPVGADLGQLLVGEVQIGRASAEDLAERDEVLLSAYARGLRAEGHEVDDAVLRRSHAVHMVLMTGLSSVPWEHLAAPPSTALERIARDRAAVARFCLDRLDATGAHPAAGVTMGA
ncbi:phosphotransferase [Phycicoccus flavus]|uniref:Aminoglycoside phosphotransferase domain-containing protein n=1 Tax=Phycicoccus flavus TaxID=2502783 RepID=A0A8T6R2I0_9MICO|nr:phosphotransferase [Phycicoccus flavus]NHA68187.1 hypothetical protein [Phycicoccus flavus]